MRDCRSLSWLGNSDDSVVRGAHQSCSWNHRSSEEGLDSGCLYQNPCAQKAAVWNDRSCRRMESGYAWNTSHTPRASRWKTLSPTASALKMSRSPTSMMIATDTQSSTRLEVAGNDNLSVANSIKRLEHLGKLQNPAGPHHKDPKRHLHWPPKSGPTSAQNIASTHMTQPRGGEL